VKPWTRPDITFDFKHEPECAAIGYILGEKSVVSNDEHGVMLSAHITQRASNDEVADFYRLAARLGTMSDKPTSAEKLQVFVRLTQQLPDLYALR
jgi:hypothetical protein